MPCNCNSCQRQYVLQPFFTFFIRRPTNPCRGLFLSQTKYIKTIMESQFFHKNSNSLSKTKTMKKYESSMERLSATDFVGRSSSVIVFSHPQHRKQTADEWVGSYLSDRHYVWCVLYFLVCPIEKPNSQMQKQFIGNRFDKTNTGDGFLFGLRQHKTFIESTSFLCCWVY